MDSGPCRDRLWQHPFSRASARGRGGETAGGTMNQHRHHGVVHLELHTHDLTEVRSYLWQLLGWRSAEVRTGGSTYLALSAGDRVGGGIVECGRLAPPWVAAGPGGRSREN